ncbi:uncharacterized protein NPIL_14901 [Nephila pilipes]|uniref:Uncharacterized protein n=1 Tax=Nephila pilipes TaxID=299642 RepID=A0A8X6QLZ3_NEPPI|nr:uncharacterized protein NPIL_14901 [Nephila pilipes]
MVTLPIVHIPSFLQATFVTVVCKPCNMVEMDKPSRSGITRTDFEEWNTVRPSGQIITKKKHHHKEKIDKGKKIAGIISSPYCPSWRPPGRSISRPPALLLITVPLSSWMRWALIALSLLATSVCFFALEGV